MGESLVLVLSDTHCGKHTKTFNPKVFQGRLSSIPQKLKAHPAFGKPEELVVILAGDMVDGENIFPHHQAVLKESCLEQTLLASNVLGSLVEQLVRDFQLPVRVETIPGNHGRASKIHHPDTNFDNVLYAQLSEKLLSTPNVDIKPNFEPFKVIKVQGTKILLYHHGVGHLGTPAMRNKFCGWMQRFGTTALVHGHHHRMDFNHYRNYWRIANGSLPGADDYSDELGEFEPASQVFFTVSDRLGICNISWLEW